MSIGEDLAVMLEGKMPEGSMMVSTTHNSDNVEMYGTNGHGFKIPFKELDEFIKELEKGDRNAMMVLEKDGFEVMVPGHMISKTIQYLKHAKTFGVKLGEYKQIF